LNKNILYLLSVLESIEKIKLYTTGFTDVEEFFEANYQKDFNASLTLLISIGEDVKNLEENVKEKSPDTDWQSIVDMRNILSHNYRGVDKDIVWDIIFNYLDPLKKTRIELLRYLNPTKEKLSNILNTFFFKEIRYLEELIYQPGISDAQNGVKNKGN
jgi:uncharacterized protein with HEPN domain